MAQKTLRPPVKPDNVLVDFTPGDADSHYRVGHLMAAFGHLDDAHEHLAYAAAESPRNSQYLFEAGFNLHLMGDHKAAVPFLVKAAALDRRAAFCRYALGGALAEVGNKPAAIKYLQQAVDLDPNCERFRAALEKVRPTPAPALT